MNVRSILIVATALLCVSSAALAADPIAAKADAGGGIHLAATLAPLGSFEFKAAPSYTRVAVVRRNALNALRKGSITADQAEAIQGKADAVRALLDLSVSVCKQNNKTGKCTKDGANAERLLKEANAMLAKL